MSTSLRIAGVTRRSGFAAPTLRYYEQLGLLSPSDRTQAGYRPTTSRFSLVSPSSPWTELLAHATARRAIDGGVRLELDDAIPVGYVAAQDVLGALFGEIQRSSSR